MTMLDRMRRHRNWLKWSLGLVCLAFVIFYIPDFLGSSAGGAASGERIAAIEGREVTVGEFRRAYQAQLDAYRSAYGSNMSEQLLKQLGIEQQILQQLVDEQASLAEADRLGIEVSDEEVRQRIVSIPAFQENGHFIGEQRYQQLLRAQNPPLTPAVFEEGVRRSLRVDKLRASLTDWLSVPDAELEREYRRRNDKVRLAVVSFLGDSFRTLVSASDAETAAYFEAHQDDFRIPERRKIRFLLIDLDQLRAQVTVPPADVERAYNETIAQFSTPEQVRASHILFRFEGEDEAAVRTKAEEVLRQARAGADFAALARRYSEDTATAQEGGDLDYFGRGRMVPEFDEAAFAMEPGELSDLVKTSFGYHIIKLVDKTPASTQPLAEVREQLADELAQERAQTDAAELAQSLRSQIKAPADLETAAKANGLTVQESGFFAREEPILGLGAAPEVASRVFAMSTGEAAGPVQTSRGYVFAALDARQDPYVPKLEDVQERVRDAVVKEKAVEVSAQKAAELASRLARAADFEQAVRAAGFEPKTTELIARGAPLPDLGIAPAVHEVAFGLPVGAVSGPIATGNGAAIVKVIEKQETSPADYALVKDRFREEVLAERRGRFFSAYMMKAKQRMKIEINQETLLRAVNPA
jgi:peptidyl-prolyl cis-trans isomerase D